MAFISSLPLRTPTRSTTTPLPHSLTTSLPAHSTPRSLSRSTPRMLFGLSFFEEPDTICLPAKDADPAQRADDLSQAREEYKWSYDTIGTSPFIDGLPDDEKPSPGWVVGIARTVLRVKSNDLAVRFDDRRDLLRGERIKLIGRVGEFVTDALQKISNRSFTAAAAEKILDGLDDIFTFKATGKGGSFKEYKDLFKVFKPDKVALQDQFNNDEIFGWYRIAGPSPMHLNKLDRPVSDMFPELNDTILQGIDGFNNDSLAAAEAEGRLFYVDYPEFEGVPPGKLPDGSLKEGFYVYGPTCLLAVPKDAGGRKFLLPVAIRCGQGSKYPMYTPNKTHTDEVTWIAAKSTVQVADAVMHETRYHLGRTHLLLEIFICAANRTMAPNHPLLKFLKIHFEGTAFINWLGSKRLAAPGGTIDVITAPDISVATGLCTSAIDPPFRFEDQFPDKEFANRGVLEASQLHYPFRDDAIQLWGAILKWVDVYVRSYYLSDDDVASDPELADWCKEIRSSDGGRFGGFGETDDGLVKTVDYLVQAVATMVYIGSVQHAALNFSQGKYMQFVPAMPLVGLSPAPTTPKPFRDVSHWVEEMLPDLETAQRQLNTAELLAGFQWTTLGDYGRDLHYVSDEVEDALKEFKEDLSEIGSVIQKRNRQEREKGLPVYDFLVPRNIPQSTNV